MTGKATGWIQTPGFKLGLREARTLPGELLICLNKFHVLVHRAHLKTAGDSSPGRVQVSFRLLSLTPVKFLLQAEVRFHKNSI